jgi:hypothetical protein
MAAGTTGIEHHPDIAALRARYEMAAENPAAHVMDGLMFLTGLYLAISPWVVGFRGGLRNLVINNLIIGIALAVLALCIASAHGRTHGVTWVLPIIGLWTIIAPFVMRGHMATTRSVWNNVITGAIALLLGLGAMGVIAMRTRGGGEGGGRGGGGRGRGRNRAVGRDSGVGRDTGMGREGGMGRDGGMGPGGERRPMR